MRRGGHGAGMSARDHADKAGVLGTAFVSLCCLGIPAVLSIVAAIGLGFLINDAILIPLLILSLAVTFWGLFSGWRRHRRPLALALAVVASAALVVFIFVHTSRPFALASIGVLVAASVLNAALLSRGEAGGPPLDGGHVVVQEEGSNVNPTDIPAGGDHGVEGR